MGLVDLGSWLDDDALDVPGVPSRAFPEGRTYRVPSPDYRTGLRLTALMELGAQAVNGLPDLSPEERAALSPEALADRERAERAQDDAVRRAQLGDDDERQLMPQVLGSAWDEMCEDGVSWVRIQRIFRYALLFFAVGPEAAEQSVRRDPPVPANREARRLAQKSSPASGGTATSTRSRASTSGTSRARSGQVTASAGGRSSSSGT